MTALQKILDTFRETATSEREKGTYFEELTICYLKNEATYKDLYSDVWTYAEWAELEGLEGTDTGIDLVAKTRGTDEFHAIQCKLYAEDHTLQKKDIDSFFTASGKTNFSRRIIVCTTNKWSGPAENSLSNQNPPVFKIDLHDLENSQIDWSQYQPDSEPIIKEKYDLRDHQKAAYDAVEKGLKTTDRGKLIMACGTGKTFTSLKIAEGLAGKGKRVLFMVPSLALLSQTLTEWTQQSKTPLHSFAVCSDSDVGKKRKKDDDSVQVFAHELRYPATTKADKLARAMEKRHDSEHMSVVFSTYHSIDVLSRAQYEHNLPEFDLIICDEAHRTTGATFAGEDESNFVKVHEDRFLKGAKRIYMTATPRLYSDTAKTTAERDDIVLCSMDNEEQYGKDLYTINFSEAVKLGLLCDYKVLVLSVDETHVSRRIQSLLSDENNQLKVDDAAKIIGCWKALSKQDVTADLVDDSDPMKRAVAFCQVIEIAKKARKHKVSSKNIAGMFQQVVASYQKTEDDELASTLACEAEHVDGSMNASEKEEKLDWLRAESPDNTCRILSNVRCLSEGVDVPALDAVLFLTPRNSQVDVVQSVGRVMRNAPGKKRGYVILPVVIPAGKEPHEALNDNVTYKVVWQVLQALRSHDDRFDAMVNKTELIGPDISKIEVVAITDKINAKTSAKKGDTGKGSHTIGAAEPTRRDPVAKQLTFEISDFERAIYAKLVQKCGNRHHWEDWANDIAKIAQTHINRIHTILEDESHVQERKAFQDFAEELRDDLNDSITDDEVIEMLAQHLITKPVFDSLFEGYSFAQNNPISQAMQGVLDTLQEHRLDKEADTLEKFYDSVKLRAEGIDSAEGKQKIVVELYDKFFRNAFPKMTERLGIVYTPVEVVDFIIHSVNDVLKSEFGQTLGSEGVHIIDPFTGTGTFITRLLQSGLISPEQLPHKYRHEIHANEIVLLAYYIAAINIEAVYHTLMGGKGEYEPFEGICLTDTFQMYEKDDLISVALEDNSDRRKRQKELDIRVIMGNPPYSVGQGNENDNNQNIVYPTLDESIRNTYVARSKAVLSKGLYDSYIRAIRWASDRIGNTGVIGFVTNGGFLEANTAAGMRQCLADEFSNIYVFHLRGNQRTSGERSRQEGGKIFGSGSRAPIAISLLVKNPKAHKTGQIFFHDIGDYLSREDKLKKVEAFASIEGIAEITGWNQITPDERGDWMNLRDNSFDEYIVIGDKKNQQKKMVEEYSCGVLTCRDAWCFNASKTDLANNMRRMIDFYNHEVNRFQSLYENLDKRDRKKKIADFIDTDPAKISWSRALKNQLAQGKIYQYEGKGITQSVYRPFSKRWLYFDRSFNEMVYQMPRIFPNDELNNLVIVATGTGEKNDYSVLMVNAVPEYKTHYNGLCFPLYLYEEEKPAKNQKQASLFDEPNPKEAKRTKRDAITDEGLQEFQQAYPGEFISKEDIFYYVYGLLHSPDYRERFRNNLTKELPRIPCVKTATDFWAFSKAGRDLADLHLNYETVDMYPVTVDTNGKELKNSDYRVKKMKYGKGKDKTVLIYNPRITLRDIPLEAYDYVVNGKPALDWVVERQCVKQDKKSGIINDANDWAIETMNNPRYPLELFMRVITVSLETMKIVNGLPKLDI
ncbi:type ISP restriction/modification enzyme [Pseudodesulfovibrio sp. zrk46]|uniref:DEAD/DEAH box helicase n=1 Tax=Pseudodesulfovibrio sp. zrk46 TaxID=2725288 RepID=UPI00144A2AE2|nr:type ISP restriction/modification enzyme [Pseudodesulfovibrio sp. zrk46]QJB56560.1 DEAD/DEAH box helicase [Pseudodesulfovibrio sp. zrk46]